MSIRPQSLPALFAQGKHWRRADGTWVRVKDMHPAHRANAARMLLRDAAEYAQAVSVASLSLSLGAPDEVLESAYQEDMAREASPVAWMRSTKLYRRLVKGLPTIDDDNAPGYRVRDARDDGACPHGNVGLCTRCAEEFAQIRALRAVLAVLDATTDLISKNPMAPTPAGEVRFMVQDVRGMVEHAARQIGVTL